MGEENISQPKQGKLPIGDAISDATPMIAQFLEIKDTASDCLLFYRMGDFYELFFEDAVKAAKTLDITLTKRGQYQGKDIPMCGVPIHSHESYLHKLIAHGFKIAICEQLEDPKEAKKRGAKAVVKRGITRIVTPGTITEDNLLNARSHNYLCAIVEMRGKMALAWMDISTGDFYAEKISGKNILNFMYRIDPGEILLPEEKKVLFSELITAFDTKICYLPLSRFDSKNAEKNLCDFFSCHHIENLGDFSEEEIAAAGCLLDYVRLMQIDSMPHIRPVMNFQDNYFMEIDSAARINLEICHSPHGRKNTLLGVIDQCRSSGGARLLKEWLNAPLFHLETICARHEGIAAMQNCRQFKDLIDLLAKIGDSERALNRLSLGRGSPRDMQIIMDSLSLAGNIKSLLAGFYQSAPAIIKEAFDKIHDMSSLLETLQGALADELPALLRDSYFIRPGFSSNLDNVKKMAFEGKRILSALEQKYRKKTNIDTLRIKQNNVLGTFIEVSLRHAKKLGDDFIHRQNTSNSARFTTSELEHCARDIMEAHGQALAIELEIFGKLRDKILDVSGKIFDIARSLSILDLLTSHAEFSKKHLYCQPLMDNSRQFHIEAGKHSVVAYLGYIKAGTNDREFIANGCTLSEDSYLWLITGPNMAGKSTFLRQNALIVILAQAGLFVPAQKAHIGLVDKLFSRVGAADDIARGHSTFMVEMLETGGILDRASDKSFVILDEIGRGTATFDGLSLAHAITEYLHDIVRARTLFATHYHELNQLQNSCACIKPMHVAVKEYEGEIIFTHILAEGSAERSYGIHVARLAGISEEILMRAQEILHSLESERINTDTNMQKASFHPISDTKKSKNHYEIKKFLDEINPDSLTPREALDCLYRLKMLSSEV